MKLKTFPAAAGLAVLALMIGTTALAANKAQIDQRANVALQHFYDLNPVNKQLADKAVGILVFARVTKGGVGVGGEHGDGELLVQGAPVGYYNVAGASVGLTLGIAEHSEVILFMTQDALDHFRNSHDWSIGADANVAVMKAGAGGEYGSENMNKPILAFIYRQKGLLGDVSLQGAKISRIHAS